MQKNQEECNSDMQVFLFLIEDFSFFMFCKEGVYLDFSIGVL